MNNTKWMFWITFFFSSIIVSILTKNIFTGLMVFVSYTLLSEGWEVDYLIVNRKFKQYLLRILCVIVILAFAQWLGRSGPRWIWTFVWLLVGIQMIIAWILCRGTGPKWTLIFGILGGLSALIGVISPFIDFEFGFSFSTSFFLWLVIWLILLLGSIILLVVFLSSNNPWLSRYSYILSFLISLIVSLVSKKYWSGLIVFIGFMLLYRDIPKIMKAAVINYRSYVFSQYSGLVMIVIAMYFTYAELYWIWSPICLLAGIPFYFTGSFNITLFQRGDLKNKRHHILGKVQFSTFICCILFGLTTPGLLTLLPTINVYVGWLLVFSGMCLIIMAMSEGLKEKSWPFLIHSYIGSFFMVAAVIVFQYSDVWMIYLFLGIGGLIVGTGALGAFLENRLIGIMGGLLAIFYFFIIVMGVFFEAQYYVTKFQQVVTQPKYFIILISLLIFTIVLFFLIYRAWRKRMINKREKASDIIPPDVIKGLFKGFEKK